VEAEPQTTVRTIGEGLRALHDVLPVEACPFSWPRPTVSPTPDTEPVWAGWTRTGGNRSTGRWG